MDNAALPVLRGPRLTLRPLVMTDADALVRGVGNYDVSKWLSVVPYPYTHEDAAWFIEKTLADRARVWGICDEEGLRGVIGLEDGLGYWLAREAWGRGYGFEAARIVAAHWFDTQGDTPLTSAYFAGNERSGGVLRALGFEPGETFRTPARALSQEIDATRMVLTRTAWDARQDFTLRTPRLMIRPLDERDAAAFAALTRPGMTRMLGRIKTGMTEAEVLADLDRRRWRGYPGFTLAILHDGRFAGIVGLGGEPLSLGYFLAPDLWGRGLMTEALAAFLPEIFDRFPVGRIHADHFEDNPASGALLRKFGFVETGRELRPSLGRLEPAPAITYALTREALKVAR